ncbi:MAG: hypothetical protein IID41_00955 [Planctomycetes bacterium]|nr:hypothetical protein [Planctomycetota bacterium]
MKEALTTKPKLLRAPVSKGMQRVIRDGGDSGVGLIQRFSVTTRGEALGHGMWLDKTFLSEVTEAINIKGDQGIKSRFTHPSMSGDGLGRFLGRVKNGRTVGNQAVADLHLSELAHSTPDGDLAEFVMDMAAKEPDMFGTSIVFMPNESAELAFVADNQDRQGRFVSPDRQNAQNLPHARLLELHADDVVDEPAANPSGMFHRGDELIEEANRLLSYSLGLTSEKPQLVELEFDADRVAEYLRRFLQDNDLVIINRSSPNAQAQQAIDHRAARMPINLVP